MIKAVVVFLDDMTTRRIEGQTMLNGTDRYPLLPSCQHKLI